MWTGIMSGVRVMTDRYFVIEEGENRGVIRFGAESTLAEKIAAACVSLGYTEVDAAVGQTFISEDKAND